MKVEVKVLVAQSCPTLCNPVDCSPPGSSVHGILQVRILEWGPFPSPGDLPDRDRTQVSCIAGRFIFKDKLDMNSCSVQGGQAYHLVLTKGFS